MECALAIIVQFIKLYINYGIIKHAGGEGARRALIFRILIVCEGAAASTGQGGGHGVPHSVFYDTAFCVTLFYLIL